MNKNNKIQNIMQVRAREQTAFKQFFCFVLKMYFSLPQLFVFLFDVLSVAVFVIRDRFVKKEEAELCLNLYPCVIKY